MAYTPYATEEDYLALFPEDESENLATALRTASRHVDALTFNRIVAVGFENLTHFQQEIVTEVACRQAHFELENADLIQSVLSSYAINGVSMQFGQSWDVEVESGVAMLRDVYALLEQTGLCCRLAR